MSFDRVSEFLTSRVVRNRILFTGARRRLTSVTVRGEQMAEELNGCCLRSKFLTDKAVRSSPALIWIVEQTPALVERFRDMTPQILDVVNPPFSEQSIPIKDRYQAFRYLMLNSEETLPYLGPEPERGWKSWVVPHHHCNLTGCLLSEERIDRPTTIGYIGEPEHLHDTEKIQALVAKLGMRWVTGRSYQLDRYGLIDIGVAWVRPDQQMYDTRSNIKLTNFTAHGIPSVVGDIASYREVDRRLGGGAAIRCTRVEEILEGIAELAANRDLRYSMSMKARASLDMYSRKAIAIQYTDIIREARAEFFNCDHKNQLSPDSSE